ncbi:MAG: hypothetical protein MI864_14035, partial [Pseudomonadales bacterium]|nr:hypothetical protein [Pseudomonadales bacterium]
MKYIIAVLFALSLSACGGGSGGSSEPGPDPDPRPIPPDPPSADYHVYAPENPSAGERVAIAVYSDRKSIDSILWSQTTGSTVSILSETRKLISFVLPEAGFYSFTAELAFSDGSSSTEIIEFNAATQSRDQLDLVSDKVVLMGQTLTVRAQSTSGKPLLNTQWKQTSGPEVDVEYSSDSLEFATPTVSKDTLFTFTLTADTSTDQDLQDSVTVLVEPAVAFNSQSAWFKNRVTKTSAFNTDSEYANILTNCVYSNSLTSSTNCSFQTLPLLAQQSSNITIAEVMDRVVVSHQWMGEEFRNFLEFIDFHTDFSNLFGSVTAIVIADDINQSFFSSSTGAIYIDPHLLGLTPEQRATIVQQVDIRTTYGSGLQFGIYSRYTKDNQRVAQRISETSQDQYTVEDINYALQRLLYHELAHANDYFPADMIGSFAFNESPLSVAQSRRNRIELSSDLLVSTFPLANNYMKSLADVSFGNDQGKAVEPNSYQKSLT